MSDFLPLRRPRFGTFTEFLPHKILGEGASLLTPSRAKDTPSQSSLSLSLCRLHHPRQRNTTAIT